MMNNLNIEQVDVNGVKGRQSTPQPPRLQMRVKEMECLKYDVGVLCEVVRGYCEGDADNATLLRGLKIITMSVGDEQMMAEIEEILAQTSNKTVYGLFELWAELLPIDRIILHFHHREKLTSTLLAYHLFQSSHPTLHVAHLFNPPYPSQLLSALKASYIQLAPSLTRYLQNIQPIHFNTILSALTLYILQGCEEVGELCKKYPTCSHTRTLLNNLLLKYSNTHTIILKHMRECVNHGNIWFFLQYDHVQVRNLFKLMISNYLNEPFQYWHLLEYYFHTEQRAMVLALEHDLKEQCLVKKYLYDYFIGWQYTLHHEQHIMQTYPMGREMVKALHTQISDGCCCLMVLNKVHAPKGWEQFDPLTTSVHQAVQGMVEKLKSLMGRMGEKYNGNNQKVELAYHVIRVVDRKTGFTHHLTYQQLLKYMKEGTLEHDYRHQYVVDDRPSEQSKPKENPMVSEALLVRFLKRNPPKHSFQSIMNNVKLPYHQCQSALSRLIKRGMIKEQNSQYSYVP